MTGRNGIDHGIILHRGVKGEFNMGRLVTRSDFDGLACAMMLKELGKIDDIKFVHPKDVQDGKVELTKDDITTNQYAH